MSDYTDNPIARAWKKRYQNFSPDIQYKLDALYNVSSKEYQFNVIKKSRKHPSKGDVFIINPTEDLFLYGVVLNSNINNICGNDLYVIIILKNRVKSNQKAEIKLITNNILVGPCIVGKEYWTRGFFGRTDMTIKDIPQFNYGFYYIGKSKYVDEFGNEIFEKPDMVESFGVATITGIAYKVRKELIIHSDLVKK